jgi:peptidyl-prolyl cis-trans isomerase C
MIDLEKEPMQPDPEPRIRVDGVAISESAIAAEMQHHPAATGAEAYEEAVTALVIRQVLLHEARRQAVSPKPQTDAAGRRETDEEATIRELLAREIRVPEVDDEACRRYFENNRKSFRSPELFEAAHILYAADAKDEDGIAHALSSAERALQRLQEKPERFAEIAKAESDCSSGRDGGSLGQLALGESVPEFETFLVNLEPGQLCPVPVKTRFGAHVLRLDRRVEGHDLPYEAVKDRIAAYLAEQVWRRAVRQYLQLLIGRADIQGIDIAGADSPLVQ